MRKALCQPCSLAKRAVIVYLVPVCVLGGPHSQLAELPAQDWQAERGACDQYPLDC